MVKRECEKMIKDIVSSNETVKNNDKEMEILKEYFPSCFKADGSFDIGRFSEFLKAKVDVIHEGYELKFLGKSYAKLLASLDTTTVIKPDLEHNEKQENINSENIYISGDNLDGLKHLLKSYSRKVKCIYIDPPYNTGTDGFIYNDNFNFNVEDLVQKLSVDEIQAQRILDLTKRGSASDSAWLMFMYSRLQLAYDLLSDDGVIFISIDDNEQANLKLLCDDIFGVEKFIGEFIWRKKDGGGQAKEHFIIEHEYVIVYQRSNLLSWKDETENRSVNEYTKNDTNGKYKITKLAKWGNTARREDRPTMYFPLTTPDGNEGYPLAPDGSQGRWRVGKNRMEEIIQNGLIHWEKKDEVWIAYEKEYFSNQIKILKQRSILYNVANTGDGTNILTELFGMKDIFENPKPIELLKIFFNAILSYDDIVIDFFSGSATTAHAVMLSNLDNRNGHYKYILVQLPEQLSETNPRHKIVLNFLDSTSRPHTLDQIGIERIIRAAKKIKEENPETTADLGFKHYTLYEPNQNTLDKMETFNPGMLLSEATVLDEFGKPTVLTTWVVRDGYGFNADIQEVNLDGYVAYHCDKHLYLIDSNFNERSVAKLIEKYENDGDFNPENVILFGYSFNFTSSMMLETNLKMLKDTEKNLKINFDIRY